MLNTHVKFLILSALSCFALSSCGLTMSDTEQNDRISTAIENAANTAMDKGQTKENLILLEKVYKRNPNDPKAAVQYASALRKNGYLYKAETVLSPFANDETADIAPLIEFAHVQMERGNYSTAESYARRAVKKDDTSSSAYHALAIALDAQGNHAPAEAAFRRALESWQGDPVPVMNNLALNLAAQERVEESIAILKRAKDMAPQRREIERNLRIIKTLNEPARPLGDYYRPAPKPKKKPDHA